MSATLHVVSLPHTQTNGEYTTCAYTEKVRKFCEMMTGRSRRVILYAGEHNTAACDEHVELISDARRESWFGPHNLASLDRGGEKPDTRKFDWEPSSPWWTEMNARAIGEIAKRADPTDLLLLSAGQAQQIIADAHPSMIVAEFGVGYEGILPKRKGPSPTYAAFESEAHRHFVYGLNGWRRGREYDAVIPNFFNPDELPFRERPRGRYLLFIGRLIGQKGLATAAAVSRALGIDLIVAGPGGTSHGNGWVKYDDGGQEGVEAPGLTYVGAVDAKERAELMGGAVATLVPTVYVEPFGGVAVESMMCGTPAVTTDFGAFTETVRNGLSGYRFQTLQEAVDMTAAAADLDRRRVHDYAMSRYSLEAVAPLYDRWFTNLDGLWGEGWTSLRQDTSLAGATITE